MLGSDSVFSITSTFFLQSIPFINWIWVNVQLKWHLQFNHIRPTSRYCIHLKVAFNFASLLFSQTVSFYVLLRIKIPTNSSIFTGWACGWNKRTSLHVASTQFWNAAASDWSRLFHVAFPNHFVHFTSKSFLLHAIICLSSLGFIALCLIMQLVYFTINLSNVFMKTLACRDKIVLWEYPKPRITWRTPTARVTAARKRSSFSKVSNIHRIHQVVQYLISNLIIRNKVKTRYIHKFKNIQTNCVLR